MAVRGQWRRAEVGPADDRYVELARAIQDEARRQAEDPDADLADFERAIEQWPAELRADAAVAAFRQLPPADRWAVLAELFDDDELRAALSVERERVAVTAARLVRQRDVALTLAARRVLDTRAIGADDELVLGLFLAADVDAALRKGPSATTCARRVVLRATGDDGRMIVIEDVFNPQRGLFVTPDYDDAVWRRERLDPFATVRVGAATSNGFEPVVYPGGRVDVEAADGVGPGRLHAGYATLSAISLFTDGLS